MLTMRSHGMPQAFDASPVEACEVDHPTLFAVKAARSEAALI